MALTRVINEGIGSASAIAGEGTATTNLQQGLAKMWAGTDGSGTPAIQDSFNNASITDNGTGDYSFTFTNNMGNDDYSSLSGGERSNGGQANISGHTDKTTSIHRHGSKNDGGTANDMLEASYLVHGDIA